MIHPKRAPLIPSSRFAVFVVLAIALFLVIDYGTRTTAGRAVSQSEQRLRAEIEALRAEQEALKRRREYVQTDPYVERWARDVPVDRPARIHGDLWSGNVVWTAHGAVLIDAGAAHGGHPETDLAMLALFGLPHLERVVRAYDAEVPLAPGWPERVPLMQLHPLLVHVVLFGGGYVSSVRAAIAALT